MKTLSENKIKRRLKISKAMKERRPEAAILANTGKECSKDKRLKIGLANKGKGGKCRKNYHPSKETIEKIRQKNIGQKRSEATKEKQRLAKLKNPVKYWLNKKRSIETIEKIRRTKKGCSSPRKGVVLTQKTKDKMSKSLTGRKATEEQKKNYKNAALIRWENPEYAQKVLCVDSPNKQEKQLLRVLNELMPGEYQFVGNGKIVISRKIPDFIDTSRTKLIEMFGDFYHKNQNPQERIDFFSQYGYRTLVIWASELRNNEQLKTKIINFHYGEVNSI